MHQFNLRIITPKRIVAEVEVVSVTAPGVGGEFTVLFNHMPLFSLLKEGVVTVRTDGDESFFSIGGGDLETTGKEVNLLVSRAYGQDEIDEKEVEKARMEAERLVKEAPSEVERKQALEQFRRSVVDLKVLKMKGGLKKRVG